MTVGAIDLAGDEAAAWRIAGLLGSATPDAFRGTVADNIRLGVPAAGSDREFRRRPGSPVRITFVRELPDGYETLVGDGGRQLSAGQLQRIAARARVPPRTRRS